MTRFGAYFSPRSALRVPVSAEEGKEVVRPGPALRAGGSGAVRAPRRVRTALALLPSVVPTGGTSGSYGSVPGWQGTAVLGTAGTAPRGSRLRLIFIQMHQASRVVRKRRAQVCRQQLFLKLNRHLRLKIRKFNVHFLLCY